MYNAMVDTLRACGQAHVAAQLDARTSTLDDAARAALHAQLLGFGIDVARLPAVLDDSLAALRSSTTTAAVQRMRPPRHVYAPTYAEQCGDDALARRLRADGYALLRRGGGAVLLLAGGSGTRLGAQVPKGTMPLDHLPSHSTLFDVHCARIARVQALAAAAAASSAAHADAAVVPPIPLFVMTSRETDAATRAYFAAHDYCGLQPSQVYFFVQGSLPCFAAATRTLCFSAPGVLCTAPAGNGDVYRSLATAPARRGDDEDDDSNSNAKTCLQVMRELGVEHVQMHNVDNLLARVADPLLFGCPASTGAHVVVKAVPKRSPDEAVGVFAVLNGKFGVVEYTELGAWRAAQAAGAATVQTTTARRRTQPVSYSCANIGSQQCSVDLIALAAQRMATEPHYHAALKPVQTHEGKVDGVRLEAFIFDAFRLCHELPLLPRHATHKDNSAALKPSKYAVLLVRRCDEFAPIKNADGAKNDTPMTASRMLLAQHTRWCTHAIVQRAARIHSDSDATYAALQLLRKSRVRIELSPRISYAGEDINDDDAKIDHIVHTLIAQDTKARNTLYIAKL